MPDASDYVRGETYARRERPRFEYKPSATGYTGGGYARIRSTERRENTPGDGTDDVFVSVHRLAAVAWHLPDEWDLAMLDGVDIHHTLGMPAANGEQWTEAVSHDRHSEITQSQMRAWATDARDAAEEGAERTESCADCGAVSETLASVAGHDGPLCLDCARRVAKATGEAIEL
jgi:hypothetical protein